MALTRREAEELADFLPAEMRCGNSRERLLCLAELLRTLTDRDHALSNAEIRAVLGAKFGLACAPSENTIAADLKAIGNAGCLGIRLHTGPKGTWAERTDFDFGEVRLLLNAVQSSRMLTVQQSNALQEGIFGLVSRRQEDDLIDEVIVANRQTRKSQKVLDVLDRAARARRAKRRLEFKYTYTRFDGKACVLPGDDGKETRCETVVALYYMGDTYYVETYSSKPWRHGMTIVKSRADRMIDVSVSDVPEERTEEVRLARRYARGRIKEGHGMFDGKMRTIFLRVRSDMTNVFFDRFGQGAKFFMPVGPLGDPSSTRLTVVAVPETFAFFRWLSSAGTGIVMEQPPEKIELSMIRDRVGKRLEGKSREDLLADYEIMLKGYLRYLDDARAPYV